jgi:hypothetical protein
MKWAHLLCAMWIPEVSLGNATFQEPVQDVEKVPKTRWKLVSGEYLSLPDCVLTVGSLAIFANRRWERVFNAATSLVSKPFTSHVHEGLDYAYA